MIFSVFNVSFFIVFWVVFFCIVIVWYLIWSVNFVCYVFGYCFYDIEENSWNNWLVVFFVSGEGWYNNYYYDLVSVFV